MRIKTQFVVTMLLFGAVLVAISASAIITNQRVESASEQGMVADNIAQGASELSYLANDYVIYRESQQLDRWQARFTSFSGDVSRLDVDTSEQQALVRNIEANTRRLRDVFDSVASAVENSPRDAGGSIAPALLQVSWSRIAVQSQSLVSDASRLSQLLDNQIVQLQRMNTVFVIALIGVFIAYFLANYTVTQRRALQGIARLQSGTAAIGSGNLDFRIEENKNDEIGELARDFNRMTASLKDVTASKVDLEREMATRRVVEEALRESEEKYRTLFSGMTEGFALHEIILDEDGKPCDYRFLEINDAFERLTGLNKQAALGRKVKEVLPDIEPYWIETYGRVALTGEPAHFENYSTPLNRWYETYAYSPRQRQFAVVFTDITKRKKAEAEIAHLASFPELNPNPVIELDIWGNIRYANQASRTRFPDLAELGSKHPFLLDALNHIQKGDRNPITCDIKDGRGSWYEQTIAYEPATQNYRIYARDITMRKQSEESLKESEEKFRIVANFTYDWEYWRSQNNRFIYMSPSCLRFTGYTSQEFIENPELYLSIIHPDDRDRVAEHMKSGLHHQEGEEMEFRIIRRDGQERWMGHVCQPVLDEMGNIQGRRSSNRDITESKRSEEEIRRTNAELEAANRELETFSYSVSHDLRAPLRSMEGFSSALLEDYGETLDDQGREYLRRVQESSNMMARLIDDLLKLSRVTRADMRRERVNLSELAGKTVAGLQETKPERSVEVNIAPGITAYGDHNLLRLVLENLLGNAWKFSSKVDSPQIEMGITRHNGRQAYFIRDNGAGFDMTYADKLFKPFQRLHRTSEFSGTGIGLATVQRIVRRHGGEIWAESRVGEGATFYFTLS